MRDMPTVLLRSEESGGVVSAIELSSPPGFKGPPLHHHAFDEAFYVLEGELTFQLRDEVFTRRAGELAFAPRDVPHTYANHSDAPARGASRVHARRLRALLRPHAGEARRFGGARLGPCRTYPETTVVGPQIGM